MKKPIAFLYPGQGAQHIGMGVDLHQNYPVARHLFNLADRILNFPLSRICFKGPEEELNKDLNAQLAVFTISCIITEILKGHEILPETVSGYSSGFYAAAYAAGCFDFAYGLDLVRCAGEILLQEGGKINGKMAVIFGLAAEEVKDICLKVGNVDVAIVNTPRQIIISGIDSSIRQAMDLAMRQDALDTYLLPAATAYHSRFMQPGSDRFLDAINENHLKDSKISVTSYLSLESVYRKKELKKIMAAQLSGPVLWVDLVKHISDNGSRLLLEVGPGAVIFRTVRWIDRNIEMMSTATVERLNTVIEKFGNMNT